jgi:hypothetical protein
MLPQQVVNTARKAVNIAMQDRREAFPHAVAEIIHDATKRGVLMSGMTVQGVSRVVATEYEVRAQLAWQAWLRALSSQRSVVTTDLRGFLLMEIERALEADSQDLPEKMAEMQRLTGNVSGPNPLGFLLTARARALEKVASEIDYAILEATSKHARGPDAATFNFYGTVGAVMTGAGATANMTITADQRQAIVGALNAVQEAVTHAQELAPAQRTQVVELVAEATTEAQKEQPNALKLRAVLGGIGMAIMTLGSAHEAYNLLKGAAALIGLHLP